MTSILLRDRREDAERPGEEGMEGGGWRQRSQSGGHASRNAQSHQKLEEARTDATPEPLEGAQARQHFSGGLLASRAVSQCISVVLRHQVCGNLSQKRQETNTSCKPKLPDNRHLKITGKFLFEE